MADEIVAGQILSRGEPRIPFNSSGKEYQIGPEDNIVIGPDRHGPITTGYPNALSVDIVVGRGKATPDSLKIKNGPPIKINPDFSHDAARIYISEKSDVDDYFGLVKGNVGFSRAASSIALKADSIRVIGVEGVKIVTRANSTNSSKGEPGFKGIELIAGNDDTYLQPMVKGDNLKNCLNKMIDYTTNVQSQVHSLMNYLEGFVADFAFHAHTPPGSSPPINAPGVQVSFQDEAMRHYLEDNTNADYAKFIKSTYLNQPKNLPTYILSPYNKTN